MKIWQIAAMAKNHVIGNKGKIPWHIKEDFKYFKETTMNHILIMGRVTFESLPKGPLPGRLHIVVSRKAKATQEKFENVIFVNSIEEALNASRENLEKYPEPIFIAGGGEIYTQTLIYTEKILLTVIDKEFEGDAYYPKFDLAEFKLKESIYNTGTPSFSFNTYIREKS